MPTEVTGAQVWEAAALRPGALTHLAHVIALNTTPAELIQVTGPTFVMTLDAEAGTLTGELRPDGDRYTFDWDTKVWNTV